MWETIGTIILIIVFLGIFELVRGWLTPKKNRIKVIFISLLICLASCGLFWYCVANIKYVGVGIQYICVPTILVSLFVFAYFIATLNDENWIIEQRRNKKKSF